MNGIIKAIEERRSIRKFQPTMPAKDDLAQIVEAGLYAASGMGRQSAIIVAVTNKELRDELAKTNAEIMGKPDFDPFYGAPAIFVVLADKSCRTAIYDGSLVMQPDAGGAFAGAGQHLDSSGEGRIRAARISAAAEKTGCRGRMGRHRALRSRLHRRRSPESGEAQGQPRVLGRVIEYTKSIPASENARRDVCVLQRHARFEDGEVVEAIALRADQPPGCRCQHVLHQRL